MMELGTKALVGEAEPEFVGAFNVFRPESRRVRAEIEEQRVAAFVDDLERQRRAGRG